MLKTFYWVKLTTNTAWHAFTECNPWREYENSYIPGYNDDVGFSLTIDECKERCMKETSFDCKSFDYWKARNQCYLSSYTATRLQIQLSRDSRMVHYMLTECPTKQTTVASTTKSGNFLCNTTHLTPQLIKHLAWTTTNINQKWCYLSLRYDQGISAKLSSHDNEWDNSQTVKQRSFSVLYHGFI